MLLRQTRCAVFELNANAKSSFLFISSEFVCTHTDKGSRQLYIKEEKKTQIQVTENKYTCFVFEKTKYLHGIVHRRKIQIHPPLLSKSINYNN